MAKKQEHTEEILTRIARKIESFLVRHLKIILISIGAAVIIAAGYFGVQYMFNKKERDAESMFSKVYLAYSRINEDSSLEEAQIEEELMALTEDFELVIDTYPNSSAASRSAYYNGNILYRFGEHEQALGFFEKGSQIKQGGYSALLCLQGAAACYEQLGEYDEAVQRYERIVEKYSDSFIVPMVRFSLAQIYEKQEKNEEARKQYDQIVSEYGWSSWAGIAEKKILVLQES
jgi:tetratricopeptide (TPR) repeat protein